jgi:PIN domain nuclease of toxin-antitoxin system
MLLLDTCTLLWLALDHQKLSRNAIKAIQKHADKIYVSAISGFEIALMVKKKGLKLPMSAESWIQTAMRLHGLRELPLTVSIAAQSVRLKDIHNDPADRFLVASALEKQLTLLSPDDKIRQYPKVSVIW